jgi:hypothetical protein
VVVSVKLLPVTVNLGDVVHVLATTVSSPVKYASEVKPRLRIIARYSN